MKAKEIAGQGLQASLALPDRAAPMFSRASSTLAVVAKRSSLVARLVMRTIPTVVDHLLEAITKMEGVSGFSDSNGFWHERGQTRRFR